MLFGQETREPLGQGTKILPARQGWRLALPLAVTASIMAIAGVLLLASQAIERNRQEQRLIADALWAEQSLEFEAQRMLDSLLALARSTSKTREAASGGRLEDRSLLQRLLRTERSLGARSTPEISPQRIHRPGQERRQAGDRER